MVTIRRIVPTSCQIVLSTISKELAGLNLKEEDVVEISIKKLKVA